MKIYQPDAASRICVIGVTGQGKSKYREWFQSGIYRYTLWNPLGDCNVGEPITVRDYAECVDDMRRGALRVTVEPTSYDEEVMANEFDQLCYLVQEVGAQHFGIEEIGLVANPTQVPANFNRLCIKGRHRAVSVSIYGQRFHQFPLIARGQCSEIVAFRQTDPDDVRDFNKRIAPARAPIPLNHLPDFHFIHWTPEDGAILCSPIPIVSEDQEFYTDDKDSDNHFSKVWPGLPAM